MDLTSWGLDALVEKDKKKGKEVKRQESDAKSYLPNPHSPLQVQDNPGRKRPVTSSRTMSMGNMNMLTASQSREDLDNFGLGGAFLEAKSTAPLPGPSALGGRRHSVGSPLDYANVRPSDPSLHRRKASAHALIDSIPVTPPLHAVPFPAGGRHTPDADVDELGGLAYDDEPEPTPVDNGRSSFALPPPSPDRASRFDPKVLDAQRGRVVSTASMGTRVFSPSPGPGSRPASALSGAYSPQPGRDRLYSRSELMRPKVLIMPSPLQQSTSSPNVNASTLRAREGFSLSSDGPPLPPGARTGPRASTASLLSPSLSAGDQLGEGLTPNPRATLSLSQLTFRNTLMVDGQRDVAYKDIEDKLQWATRDGEQAPLDIRNDSTPGLPAMEVTDVDADGRGGRRPAGKLYGKSLIDDLESRKAEMKGKQRCVVFLIAAHAFLSLALFSSMVTLCSRSILQCRVFTGDQRPSMMARTPMKRSSTLIDPESLKQRPTSTLLRNDSSQTAPDLGPAGVSRRNSAHAKTLINFEDEIPGAPRGSFLAADNHGGMSNTRSVFGVDTIWERELAKLREIEAREKADAEARGAVDDGAKKSKGKRKGKKGVVDNQNLDTFLSPSPSQVPEGSASAPSPDPSATAPRRVALRAPPPPADGDDDEDEESDSSSIAGRPFDASKADGWHSGSDDGAPKRPPPQPVGPRRTTGSGPRFVDNLPPRFRALQEQHQLEIEDDDSEEDVPLVATIGRAAQRATRADFPAEDSSDEEKPLSALIDKTKQKLPSPTFGSGLLDTMGTFGSMNHGADDEDEKPLGLRVSRLGLSPSQALSSTGRSAAEDEDERPLALHPEQLRRSQFVVAQQQQQQQMMVMQAQAAAAQMQMQQSMMFGAPSVMSAPFYAPPMGPPMMIPPQLPGTPPPMHDTAKLNRVDKWRRDVAVEGEQ